ncbi:MAG: type IV pilus assembly protein PilE [Moritella sp.]|jgi:type IV pilus assembly protein PilE
MRNIQSGFTLIELMIVVAIVGILAGIGYPSYSSYIQNTHRNDAKAGLSKLLLLQEQFYLDNNQYATSLVSGATDTLTGWGNSSSYYTFSLDPSSSTSSYTAIATVNTDSSQASDADCHIFTINGTGARTSANMVKKETDDCW